MLENPKHQKSKEEETAGHKKVSQMINKIEKAKSFSKKEHATLLKEIDMVGEEIISHSLKRMLNEKVTR